MVVHSGTFNCQLENIIFIFILYLSGNYLIQENSEDNYKFSSAEKRVLNTDIVQYSFTMRKSKRFLFLTDLE